MKLSHERKGEVSIFLSALLWGLTPVVIILSYSSLSPLTSLYLSTLLATMFFAIVLWAKGKFSEVKDAEAFEDIVKATLINGIFYFVLYFFGLKYTSAGNISIIALTETFFSYIFFNIWKKEYISLNHIIGCVLMLLGALIVLLPNFYRFQWGDILILIAALIAPFGNFFQRRARRRVGSETIMFVRSGLTALVIFIVALLVGEGISLPAITKSVWYLLISGLVMFGFTKILWLEGIHRISVTKSNALSAVSPLFTLIFAWLILNQFPTLWQMLSILPMFVGMFLLSRNGRTEVVQKL